MSRSGELRATASQLPHDPALGALFKEAMAGMCTSVGVVTTSFDGTQHGTTVSAFASLSMDPPMVLVALDRGSDFLAKIRQSNTFALNILSRGQAQVASAFAVKGADKFSGIDWWLDNDLPRIKDSLAFVACRVSDLVEGGDHIVVLGQVHTAAVTPSEPLTYHARTFGTHISAG